MPRIGVVDDMTSIPGRHRLALAAWTVGTAAEIGLLIALTVDALRRPSAHSVGRVAAPLAAERALVHGVGPLIDRTRPRSRFQRPGFLSPSSSSIPSGHASNSFLAATLLSATHPAPIVFGVAAIAATSRVALRVHRVTDVAVSAITGVGLGLAMNRWFAPDETESSSHTTHH